jgi:hypothetical protein
LLVAYLNLYEPKLISYVTVLVTYFHITFEYVEQWYVFICLGVETVTENVFML